MRLEHHLDRHQDAHVFAFIHDDGRRFTLNVNGLEVATRAGPGPVALRIARVLSEQIATAPVPIQDREEMQEAAREFFTNAGPYYSSTPVAGPDYLLMSQHHFDEFVEMSNRLAARDPAPCSTLDPESEGEAGYCHRCGHPADDHPRHGPATPSQSNLFKREGGTMEDAGIYQSILDQPISTAPVMCFRYGRIKEQRLAARLTKLVRPLAESKARTDPQARETLVGLLDLIEELT